MVLALAIVAMLTSLGLVVLVSGGLHNALTVIGGFLKMLIRVRMTPITCVVTEMEVLRMDHGATLLTQISVGNTATSLNVH